MEKTEKVKLVPSADTKSSSDSSNGARSLTLPPCPTLLYCPDEGLSNRLCTCSAKSVMLDTDGNIYCSITVPDSCATFKCDGIVHSVLNEEDTSLGALPKSVIKVSEICRPSV